MNFQLYNGKKVIWESKAKRILLILICLGFGVLEIFTYNPDQKFTFFVSIALFGGGGLFLLFQLIYPKNLFVTRTSKLGQDILAEQSLSSFKYKDEGFVFIRSGKFYDWDEINAVFAFKVDLLTTDEICLDIFMAEVVLKINESTPGWFEFTERLETALGITNGWWKNVVQPSFATNLTLVFDRQGRSKEECEAKLYK